MAVTYEKIELGTVVGPQGIQGVQGVQGPAGPQGPTGPQGPAGGTFTEDEVKEFAKEVSESYGYMKKVADSNFDMNGKDIIRVGKLTSSLGGNASGYIVILPIIYNDDLGLVDSVSMQDYFSAYIKYVFDGYSSLNGYINFESTVIKTNYGYGHITGCIRAVGSSVDSNGIPTVFSFIASFSSGECFCCRRGGAEQTVQVDKISTFSATDTSLDNRINSMGSNYIRYANGLQICWGEFTITNTIVTASGNVYARTVNMQHNYPVVFTGNPRAFVQSAHNLNDTKSREIWVGDVYTYTNKIFEIRISSPVQIADTIDMKFSYFAIGTWK